MHALKFLLFEVCMDIVTSLFISSHLHTYRENKEVVDPDMKSYCILNTSANLCLNILTKKKTEIWNIHLLEYGSQLAMEID